MFYCIYTYSTCFFMFSFRYIAELNKKPAYRFGYIVPVSVSLSIHSDFPDTFLRCAVKSSEARPVRPRQIEFHVGDQRTDERGRGL